ncbi:MAG: biotin/lipoyl-containing protein [Acidimicrobiia bacterium]
MTPETLLVQGERVHVPERIVVAPAAGLFRPLPPETVTAEGELVALGQALGVVEAPGVSVPICSPFAGFLMGMLAESGERLREGQPVAWLRIG